MPARALSSRFFIRLLPLLVVPGLLGLGPSHCRAQAEPLWGEALIQRVDSLAEATLMAGPVASLAIGIQRGEEVLLAKGYGMADVENDVPAKPQTVYRIGSVTKQFTAAAVMQLVEEGKIGLDDPMTRFLPDFPTQGNEVTIRHLLTHTSGIKSYTGLEEWQPKITLDLTDEELVDLFEDEPFDFPTGDRFLYNNSGFYLLGMIIEEASGESYRDYVKAHLFEPLGMGGSSYCDERPIIPWRAEGYEAEDGELVNDSYLSMNQPGAAGALCSTVPDLLTWTDALTSGQVVALESYAQMTTPFTLNDGSGTGYGFGLGVGELEGHPRISHGGGINGFVTMMAHYPEMDMTVVVLSNTVGGHPGEVAEAVAKWALGIEDPAVLDLDISPEEMAVYVGVYEIRSGFELTVFIEDGQLMTQATNQNAFRIRAQGNHLFIPTFDDAVRLIFAVEDGKATTAILHQGGQVIEAARIR